MQIGSANILRLALCGACGILWLSAPAWGQDALEKRSVLGPVTAWVRMKPRTPVVGDSLELEIEVTARPDVEVLMPEFGEALGRFQIIDFKTRERLNSGGDAVLSQFYSLQSPSSGEHAIPPILIEFVDRRSGERQSPEGSDAYELFTERINFQVESVLVDDATTDLNPPLGRLDREEPNDSSGVSPWAYVGVGACVLAGAGLVLLAVMTYQRRIIKRSAYEIARRQLQQLLGQDLSDREEVGRFYVRLTSIVRHYLENRFELRAPELTTEEFLSSVTDSAELSDDHKQLLRYFLTHCDLVKFAGLQPTSADIDETVERASRFLEETRENSPLVVDPESSPRERLPGQGRQHV